MTSETDTELEEQLAEARAQIESLQATAAAAEARAATARAEVKTAKEEQDGLRTQLAETEGARAAAGGQIAELESQAAGVRGQLRDAVVRYREARLAAAPDIPHDLVPELETVEDVDREFESAQRVVGQLRRRSSGRGSRRRARRGCPQVHRRGARRTSPAFRRARRSS